MTNVPDIDWFRALLTASVETEERNPAPLLKWRARARARVRFESELVGLNELDGWKAEERTGNIVHRSGQFFAVEGLRTTAHGLREVNYWDQPILTQKEGGVLALVCKRDGPVVLFLLQAKAEPGNMGTLQFPPTIQCPWSNLKRAHKGRKPPLADVILGKTPGRLVYAAEHNEEGGRFWRKTNSNRIILLDGDDEDLDYDPDHFVWASLSQIKALALIDNVLSPFVKTIIAPL